MLRREPYKKRVPKTTEMAVLPTAERREVMTLAKKAMGLSPEGSNSARGSNPPQQPDWQL